MHKTHIPSGMIHINPASNQTKIIIHICFLVRAEKMCKCKESNSSEMRRWKCGHMAAVNSIRNPSAGCRESNNININPPDTSVSDLHAAQSLLSTEKWLFIPAKLPYDAFVSAKYSCARL